MAAASAGVSSMG